MNPLIEKVVSSIDKTNVSFIYLIGSYSRGAENQFSDIDIIVSLKPGYNSYSDNKYIDNVYVSVHYDSSENLINNYMEPYKYIKGHSGIESLVVLYDPDKVAQSFLKRCNEVNYLSDMKSKIIEYVNIEVVDWIEEVNKSVSGYIYNNPSKMIEGLHGLTFGMLNVLSISEGIVDSHKGLFGTYKEYFNDDIYQILENAFGINDINLKDRVLNGLLLYKEIIKIIEYRFSNLTKQNVGLSLKNIENISK